LVRLATVPPFAATVMADLAREWLDGPVVVSAQNGSVATSSFDGSIVILDAMGRRFEPACEERDFLCLLGHGDRFLVQGEKVELWMVGGERAERVAETEFYVGCAAVGTDWSVILSDGEAWRLDHRTLGLSGPVISAAECGRVTWLDWLGDSLVFATADGRVMLTDVSRILL